MRLGKNGPKTFITCPTALPLVTMFLWDLEAGEFNVLFDRNEFIIFDGKRKLYDKGIVLFSVTISGANHAGHWTAKEANVEVYMILLSAS